MIYYFNPDTELALKAGKSTYYIAPAPVRQMAEDLALLPLWLAGSDDVLLTEVEPPAYYLEHLQTLFPHHRFPRILTPNQLEAVHRSEPIVPWGWNPTLMTKLKRWGFDVAAYEAAAPARYLLNDKTYLEKVDSQLMQMGLRSAAKRHFTIRGVAEAEALLSQQPELFPGGGFLLKEAFSSSGRGHRWCRPEGNPPATPGEQTTKLSAQPSTPSNQLSAPSEQTIAPCEHPTAPASPLTPLHRQWISRRTQRGEAIDMEPIYNKVLDFAMLFNRTADGKAQFCGYSLFETTAEGAYRGNILASDAAIIHLLSRYIDPALLIEAQQSYLQLFSQLPIGLTGPFGVDMMIYHESTGNGNGYTLHPDVEINCRPTMGLVAHRLCNRYLSTALSDINYHFNKSSSLFINQQDIKYLQERTNPQIPLGRFVVEGSASNAQLLARHVADSQTHPLVMDNQGGILKGYLPLTPVTSTTRFRAYLLI